MIEKIPSGKYRHYKGKFYTVLGVASVKEMSTSPEFASWVKHAEHFDTAIYSEKPEQKVNLYKTSLDSEIGMVAVPVKAGQQLLLENIRVDNVVVYIANYVTEFGSNTVWVRPTRMFTEMVNYEGKNVPRFKRIS